MSNEVYIARYNHLLRQCGKNHAVKVAPTTRRLNEIINKSLTNENRGEIIEQMNNQCSEMVINRALKSSSVNSVKDLQNVIDFYYLTHYVTSYKAD